MAHNSHIQQTGWSCIKHSSADLFVTAYKINFYFKTSQIHLFSGVGSSLYMSSMY